MSDEPARNDDPTDEPKAGRPPEADDPEAGGDVGDDDIEIVGYTAADTAGVPIPDVEPPKADEEEEILIADDFDDEPLVDTELGNGLEGDFEAPDGPSAGVAFAEHEAALSRLHAAEARVEELHDRLLRTTADFENFRKRVERDRADERRQAAASLVRDVLPVLDNFERALRQAADNATPSEAFSAFVDGVRLIHGQLSDILRRAGLDPVEADGIFDPNLHEALMQEVTTDAPHLSILEVFEPGYRFQGRLLRPARVKVAHNPEGHAAAEPGVDDDEADGRDEATAHESADGEGRESESD